MNPELRPCHCMCEACICCYDACDCQSCVCCCAGSCDCICIRQASCCAVGYDCLGCGIVTNASRNECCKIACILCELGIVNPYTLCSCANQFCCCQSVASLPYVELHRWHPSSRYYAIPEQTKPWNGNKECVHFRQVCCAPIMLCTTSKR